ncbi:GGDEF domain-containing protein [Cyanobium sp. Aljojuca 7A6]|nr:GGDEF domain-containing protein [Cyanobium sp. La Preciosa 7G6]MCP9937105.1 GGDEF domain-containing protein [Cyanobium sp. Aljojuca 7A6]
MLDSRYQADEARRQFTLEDPLTHLPNRLGFEKRLELALAQAKRHGWGLAVFSIDVDEFKTSNDAHGHDAGDEVLQMVAARLALVVREEDMVSRWGEGMNSSAFWWKLEVLKMLRM